MRDVLVFALVVALLPLAFRRPYVGLLLFSWLAYMRPQDLCWGFARTMRFSFLVGFVMVAGWMANESHRRPFSRPSAQATLMVLLLVLMTLSLAMAESHSQYVMTYYVEFVKIIGVALFTTGQVDTRERLRWLVWTIALSLGFYGFKNGLMSLASGGAPILRGPGGMLEDNNDFALAMVMNLPLLFYLSQVEPNWRIRRFLQVTMVLTLVTIVLTHSRGAFVATVGTVLLMAFRSRKLLQAFGVLAIGAVLFVTFAPAHVMERIALIGQGTQESSAASRIKSWSVAMNMIEANPVFGVGIRNFQLHWARNSEGVPGAEQSFAYVAHNSYLQIWAEGGTIAFVLYVLLLGSVFVVVRRVRLLARQREDLGWARSYASMFEATTLGFMIGAVFLNRGHFDLMYHWLAMVAALWAVLRAEAAMAAAPTRNGVRQKPVLRMRPATTGPALLPRWGRE